jgi:Cys-tRNA(Pro)/Cys-tRNA(Cys) deacylase
MRTSVDVHNALVERDVPHELVPIRGRLRRPDRIAGVLGLAASQVGRVVLLESDRGAVAALVASDRAVDPALVARAARLGGPPEEAAPNRATDLTGYLYEALPPVGLPTEIKVLMDRPLAGQEVLYFPGGEASSVLKIRPADLVKAVRAKVASISS